MENRIVTVGTLSKTLKILGDAVKARIDRTLAPIATRVANVEFKTGALALHLGRENPKGLEELEKLLQRVKAMETEIVELKQRPQMKYRGVWEAEGRYQEGDVTTDHGAMWHANCSTTTRPGGSSDWTLCVKRGRDAKVQDAP